MSKRMTESIHSVKLGLRSPKLSVPDEVLAFPDNFLGLEMECEGRNLPDLSRNRFWTQHVDGSLRNGIEYTFQQPLVGSTAIEAIDDFFNNLEGYDTRLVPSFRTSTHLHIDFSQERDKLSLIQDFVAAHYLLEDAFFGYSDITRKHSGYCAAWVKEKETLQEFLAAKSPADVAASVIRSNRYMGLNLKSLTKYGTIEMRHSQLLTKRSALLGWINLCLGLKKAVYDMCNDDTTIVQAVDKIGVGGFIGRILAANERLYNLVPEAVVESRLAELRAWYEERASNFTRIENRDWDKATVNLSKNKLLAKKKVDVPQNQAAPKLAKKKSDYIQLRVNDPLSRSFWQEVPPNEDAPVVDSNASHSRAFDYGALLDRLQAGRRLQENPLGDNQGEQRFVFNDNF